VPGVIGYVVSRMRAGKVRARPVTSPAVEVCHVQPYNILSCQGRERMSKELKGAIGVEHIGSAKVDPVALCR